MPTQIFYPNTSPIIPRPGEFFLFNGELYLCTDDQKDRGFNVVHVESGLVMEFDRYGDPVDWVDVHISVEEAA